MLRSEPSKKQQSSFQINVLTECKDSPLPTFSRDDCSRNSVTASVSQRAQQAHWERDCNSWTAVVTMLNPLAQRRGAERFPKHLPTSLKSNSLLAHRRLEQTRLRSGMKNLPEAGRRRQQSLLAHCHIILWSCKEQRR